MKRDWRERQCGPLKMVEISLMIKVYWCVRVLKLVQFVTGAKAARYLASGLAQAHIGTCGVSW